MSDLALSKLERIRIKIRRLTRNPDESHLSTPDINDYINSFILYDLPATVTLNSLKTTLRFYTTPNVDVYSTNTTDEDNPLYNFKNKYNIASNTAFISGNLSYFSESRSDFYNRYPRSITSKSVGTGNGLLTNFVGTLEAIPVLSNNVLFASVDTVGNSAKLYDTGTGVLQGTGVGIINYVTGAYVLTFDVAPGDGEDIYAQTCTYKASKPNIILYYNDSFFLRPVPDKCYAIEVEVYQRPTELIADTDLPQLSQWWEYIALGSARKVLIDRGNFEGAGLLEVEMENTREKILYRTVIQNSIKEGYGI